MAEKRVIELEIQDNSKSLKSQYRDAVQELQKVSAQYGETSTQAIKAAKAAAELKDQMEFSKDLIKGFNPDAKFDSLGRSIGGVLDGFQAFEGALGLVGVESEELQKTMLKVQSAMALSQGIQGLMEAKDSFKQLGAVATNALKGIKTGLAATGIGLFLVALGTIVAYWDDIKAAVSGVTTEQELLNITYEKNAIVSKEIYESLQLQENSLRLQGKTEKQILQLRIQKLNASIEDEKTRIEGLEVTSKMEIAAQERNMKWLKLYVRGVLEGMALAVRAIAIPIDKVIETANFVSKALGNGELVATNLNEYISKAVDQASEWTAKLLFDPAETKAESEKTIKEAKKGLKQMESDRDGFLLSIKENNKKEIEDNKLTSDNAKENAKDQNEIIANGNAEASRLEIERQNELNKRLEDLAEQNFQNSLTNQERELLAVQDKYFELETLAEGNKDALAQIELAKANELNDINLKYQNTAYEADKLAKEKKAELDKANYEKEIAAAKAVAEQKAAIQQQGLDTALQGVQLIANIFQNQKGVQKAAVIAESAIGIAKMIIANKLANVGALATPQAIATSGAAAAPVIALNNISTGIGIAANIAATAKALKTLGGGAPPQAPPLGGGGGTGGGGVMSPNFSVIGSSGVNQLAQLQQQPTRAYVVSGEVTSQQALDRNRVQNATL